MRYGSLGLNRLGNGSMVKTLAVALVALAPTFAHAAELKVSAPDECDLEASLREDAERLTGTQLSLVPGMDFEVEVQKHEEFVLRLMTIEHATGARRVRELRAATCSDITNAGAVALAMAVQHAAPSDPEPTEPGSESDAQSSEPPAVTEPEEQPERPSPSPVADAREDPLRAELGAGLVIDSGALPSLGFGPELELVFRAADYRFGVVGLWLAPKHGRLDEQRGGDFQLLALGILACRQSRAMIAPLVCGGFEVGSLQGEGTGVAQSRLGSAFWQVGRFDVGATARVGSWSLEARGGLAVPIFRREFVSMGQRWCTGLTRYRSGGTSDSLWRFDATDPRLPGDSLGDACELRHRHPTESP